MTGYETLDGFLIFYQLFFLSKIIIGQIQILGWIRGREIRGREKLSLCNCRIRQKEAVKRILYQSHLFLLGSTPDHSNFWKE